jgi:hypothetical protein
MDVEENSTANRADVILWPCNYHNNEVFD